MSILYDFRIKGYPIGIIFVIRVSSFRKKVRYPPSGWKIRRVGKICVSYRRRKWATD